MEQTLSLQFTWKFPETKPGLGPDQGPDVPGVVGRSTSQGHPLATLSEGCMIRTIGRQPCLIAWLAPLAHHMTETLPTVGATLGAKSPQCSPKRPAGVRGGKRSVNGISGQESDLMATLATDELKQVISRCLAAFLLGYLVGIQHFAMPI